MPVLQTNSLKAQVKMRLLHGISADIRDFINIIKAMLEELSNPNDNNQ
jgi:hypothetical protein